MRALEWKKAYERQEVQLSNAEAEVKRLRERVAFLEADRDSLIKELYPPEEPPTPPPPPTPEQAREQEVQRILKDPEQLELYRDYAWVDYASVENVMRCIRGEDDVVVPAEGWPPGVEPVSYLHMNLKRSEDYSRIANGEEPLPEEPEPQDTVLHRLLNGEA